MGPKLDGIHALTTRWIAIVFPAVAFEQQSSSGQVGKLASTTTHPNDRELTMKRILITAILSIAAAAPALAADLPQPMAPQAPAAYVPVVAPVYNWGGIYVGINGGWGWGNGKWTTGTNTGTRYLFSANANDNGGVVGGTVGANFQTGEFVFGVEGDWDYSGINTGTTSTICVVSGNCQTGDNWLARYAGVLVTRPITCCFMAPLVAHLPMCRATSTAPPLPVRHNPAGRLVLASDGRSLKIGRLRSNISTLILATATGTGLARQGWHSSPVGTPLSSSASA